MKLPGSGGLDPELDARLVQRCLAGDARAWEALVRRYERLVYAIGRSYRLSDEDLGDLFQDVFSALVRGLPRLREPRTLCRWLSSTSERIARATALRRRRELALRAPGDEPLAALAGDAEPIGADLEALERQTLVRLALTAVPERCRRLLHALFMEDPAPSYAEISQRLGVPIGSLGPTRARCVDKLRENLAGLESNPSRITGPESPTSPREGRTPPRTRGPARTGFGHPHNGAGRPS